MRKSITTLTALVGVTGLLIVAPSAAFSATEEEVSSALLETVTETLDISVTDTELLELLAADLEYAITEEVLDADLVASVSDAIDASLLPDVSEIVEENLGEQQTLWPEESGQLGEALGAVKQEFYQCRAAAEGPANECAQGFGFRIQVALTDSRVERVEQLQAQLGELSGEALAQAEAELLQAQERLTVRLERLEQKIVRTQSRGENAERLRESLGKAEQLPESRQPSRGTSGSDSDQSTPGSPNPGPGSAPGESGGNSQQTSPGNALPGNSGQEERGR